MNGERRLDPARENMIAALRQMEQMVRAGQVAHVAMIGVQASGAHAVISIGMPGVVSDQAVVGALDLAKADIVQRVLEAQKAPRSRLVQARPVDPAMRMQ